jgi:pimeloyl-ACP methyl ester carboxylesterase
MFRELIPRLATRYRVIAPDLPGFGFTRAPEERDYKYSFDALARTVEAFVNALGLAHDALYDFDYGAPVGYRLAVAHPEQVMRKGSVIRGPRFGANCSGDAPTSVSIRRLVVQDNT